MSAVTDMCVLSQIDIIHDDTNMIHNGSHHTSTYLFIFTFKHQNRVIDSEGKKFNIPDKDVRYSMSCPNSPGQANKLYDEFCQAQEAPLKSIQDQIEVSADLLEMAWEETAEENE